jgi:hypothetical protein
VLEQQLRRSPGGPGRETGAVLVTVVVVMFIGVVIATTVAATVTYTLGANADNQDRTSAYIAAESGRDVGLANLVGGIDSNGDFTCDESMLQDDDSDSTFSYEIMSTKNPDRPSRSEDFGVEPQCPDEESTYVVIRSVGYGPDGAQASIDSVYPWRLTHVEQPAGTMAYFDGEFKATKSTYTGDLVVRDPGKYYCNNSSVIDGDLWVVKGNVELSTGCVVTGSIYALGTVESSSSGIQIGGDIVANGSISLSADGAVIEGDLRSGVDIDLKNTGATDGKVGGDVVANGAATVGSKWTNLEGLPITATSGGPMPSFDPTLADVFEVTKWLEMNGISGLSATGTEPTKTYATCDTAEIKAQLANASDGRAVFDMSACLTASKKVVEINLTTDVTVSRDAVFYVPAAKGMNLTISAPVRVGSGDPQLLVVHADTNPADGTPSVCPEGQDSLSISAVVQPRLMIYSPCGLNGNISVAFSGQLYTANSGNHLVLSNFTCKPMQWLPAMGRLSCGIKGEDGALDTEKDVFSVDPLTFQAER